MKAISFFLSLPIFLFVIIVFSPEIGASVEQSKLSLPETSGRWTKASSVRKVTDKDIFQYMNGAGEIYLGYQFDHLNVYEYKGGGLPEILVEIYWMKSSDDAFGLLSLDWGGEPVIFDTPVGYQSSTAIAPASQALYGAGLLRIWSGNIYIRILVEHESAESKEAVLSLGKMITEGRNISPRPRLLNMLSFNVNSEWKLRSDRIGYFRSYLVLNTLHFLSFENILNLDRSTEAVFVPYERKMAKKENHRIQFLLIKYESDEQARSALQSFCESYLEEINININSGKVVEKPQFYKVEEGWVGFVVNGRYLSLVLNSQGKNEGLLILNQIQSNLKKGDE